jgi:glucan phosphoethanolaminetransferase (alkaline phosphatase superfamily)
MSVPVLLTPSTAESLQDAPTKPSVVSIFRGAGFHTAWFSTQRKHGMYDTACSVYSKDAHETAFLSGAFAPATGSYESAFDGELLEPVRRLISRGLPKTFIVLHTMGSHQHYSDRYPPEFERFKCGAVHAQGSLVNATYTPDEKRLMTNAFDNSILYTDWVLTQLVEALGSTHAVSALFYVSDHGQNTGEAAVMPFGHGTRTEDVIHVPMLIWLSPQYRTEQSARTGSLASHVSSAFSADTTFHTLVDMAGLDCALLDRKKSAASDEFKPGRRMVRSMEGTLSDYDERRLRWQSSKSP